MLKDLLTTKTVEVRTDCDSWQEAVERGGELLENINAISHHYTEAMKQSIVENGPYVVIAPHIALLHARPEDGVNEVCMSLQIINTGVHFGYEKRDPVKLVFAFGAIDSQSHLKALQQLMELFNNENLLEKLKNSETNSEAVKLLNKYL
ncbi:PTS sugar transporter subunit IIA [Paraliobacillus salinarum]|uniref:PTS sugar transporter subunit IIA n=1 Tax=Paraliobacillus salinarum TaxID=1158996 RepID=UPI0015F3560C|nr:PTS sugar transporter subunit IIA [Paraliobacillus salinarum]